MKCRFYKLLSFLLLACGTAGAQTVDLNAGLIMHLPLNGNARDTTSFANHGTLYGTLTPTTDESGGAGNALMFDGNTYIAVPSNDSLNVASFSVCAKVYPMGFYQGQYYENLILTKGASYWTPGQYALQFDPLFLEVGPNDQVGTAPGHLQDTLNQTFTGYCYGAYPEAKYFNYTPRMEKNKWYTLVLTAASDSIKFYLNGSLIYTYGRWSAKGTNSNDIRIGKHESSVYPYSFTGKMSDIRFYNRPLNAKEVETYSKPDASGIAEVAGAPGLVCSLSPNPVAEQLELNFEAVATGMVHIAVMDISGRIVQQAQYIQRKGPNKTSLSVTTLPAGTYVVSLKDDSGHKAEVKFIRK